MFPFFFLFFSTPVWHMNTNTIRFHCYTRTLSLSLSLIQDSNERNGKLKASCVKIQFTIFETVVHQSQTNILFAESIRHLYTAYYTIGVPYSIIVLCIIYMLFDNATIFYLADFSITYLYNELVIFWYNKNRKSNT